MLEENKIKIKSIIEALLFVANRPLPVREMHDIVSDVEMVPESEIHSLLEELKLEYQYQGRSFQLEEIAGGYQLRTQPLFAPWLSKLVQKGTEKLSQAILETAAIVAYRQPITKAEIEAVRGVDVTGALKKCQDLGIIDVVGKKETLGRPFLYGTTEAFLQYFGLRSLEELPRVEELRETATGQQKIKLPEEPRVTGEAEKRNQQARPADLALDQ